MSENPENIVLKVQESIDHVKDLIRYSPSIARLERNLEGDHDEKDKDKDKDETKEVSTSQNDTAHVVVEEKLQISSETPVQKKTDLLQDRINDSQYFFLVVLSFLVVLIVVNARISSFSFSFSFTSTSMKIFDIFWK